MDQGSLNKKYLEALDLIQKISYAAETASYIWGGLSLDIYKGMFLRSHHDIDCLTFDLWNHFDEFEKLFKNLGWTTQRLVNGDLKVEREEVKIHFGNIRMVGGRIQWDHNGMNGFIRFPLEWLNPLPQRFYGVKTYVVEPELEYALKTQPQLLNPDWKLRVQDKIAIEELAVILFNRRIDTNQLFECIEGYALS